MKKFLHQLRHRTPLGWLQLTRNRSRLLVAVSGIAFADLLIFMQLGIERALYESNNLLNRRMNADIMLISPRARNVSRLYTFSRRRLYQAMALPEVENVNFLYINFALGWKVPSSPDKTAEILVVGQNPNHISLNIPAVNQQLNQLKIPYNVLFDRAARGEYKVMIAQVESGKPAKTEIDRSTVSIVGLFQLGASFATDGTIITSDQTFLRLFPQQRAGTVNLGLVNVKPGYDPSQVVAQLNANLPADVIAKTHAEFLAWEEAHWRRNTPIGVIFSLGTMLGFVIGIVIVYQVLSMDVNDHMSEYATFKAIGYRNVYLLGVVLEESLILAVLGFLPGLLISWGLYQLIQVMAALPMVMPLGRVVMVLFLTIIMCVLSGAIAGRQLKSADPADIFK